MTIIHLLVLLLVIWLVISLVNSMPQARFTGSSPIMWLVILIVVLVLFSAYGGIGFRWR